MSPPPVAGWGSIPWGAGPWGSGGIGPLQLLSALAVRENVVRLTFNQAPLFNLQYGPNDASNPERFSVRPIATTVGRDGAPPRPVTPIAVEVAKIPLSLGSVLDVTMDRMFSPFEAAYLVACNQLVSIAGDLLDPLKTSRSFLGVFRELVAPTLVNAVASRDIANPQTYSAQLDPLPGAGDPLLLGVIPLDASGDYAFDSGVTNLRKRVFRRLLTTKGKFPANPSYGVGVPTFGKRLGIAGVRQQLAAEAQAQLSQEPDVQAVSVTAFTSKDNPSVTIFRVLVQSTSVGQQQIDVPFSPV